MVKILLIALFLSAMSIFVCYAEDTAVGAAELHLLEHIFTGNIGLTIGLAIATMGILAIVNGDAKGGVILIVLAVLVTLLPGFFNGIRLIVCPVTESLGGHCGKAT